MNFLFFVILSCRINIITRDYFFKFFGPNNFENLKNISEEDAKKIYNEFLNFKDHLIQTDRFINIMNIIEFFIFCYTIL